MEIIYGIIEQGLIYGLVALAIFLTLRIIDFPDMGVNSTFTLGAATWFLSFKANIDVYTSSILAFAVGCLAGYITAALHLCFNIKSLLASIIMMIGLYSINMRLLGHPNIPLMNVVTIFNASNELMNLLLLGGIVLLSIVLVGWFLQTDLGLGIRVSGQNYILGETYGVSRHFTVSIIVALSNGLIALSGALLGQKQGFIDINMGQGVLIIGLISVIIGEKIYSTKKVYIMILMPVIGAIFYKIAITLALFSSDLGLQSSDIYILTALMMISIMIKKPKY